MPNVDVIKTLRIRVWPSDGSLALPHAGCEWRAASGGGWKLWQRLPYLSSETCASSAKKDPGAGNIFTSISYSGGTVSFTAKTLPELATLEFENGAGDTESNGTGAEKWVEVPFHNGTYDFYIPKPIELEVYTRAWIDASDDTLHTERGTAEFVLTARAYTPNASANQYDRKRQICDPPTLTSEPPASAFEPITEQNGVFTTTRTPIFGVRNCNGASAGDAGCTVHPYPSYSFNRVPASMLDRSKTYRQDFVMACTGSVFAEPWTDYLDPGVLKLVLSLDSSSTQDWPWMMSCSRLEY